MKNFQFSLIVLSTFFSLFAIAQKTAITDIPTEEDTTISITKGTKATVADQYEITEGKADIAGEPEIMVKAARASWLKACSDWKKETKELNKDNIVLALNCNSPSCTKNETSETFCTSNGSYKIKTKK